MEMTIVVVSIIIVLALIIVYAIHKGIEFLNNREDGGVIIECGDSKRYFRMSAFGKKSSSLQRNE